MQGQSDSIHCLVEVSILFVSTLISSELTTSLSTAEDVLADLGVRQAMRAMPKDARL